MYKWQKVSRKRLETANNMDKLRNIVAEINPNVTHQSFTFPGTGLVETGVGVGIPKRFRCTLSSKAKPLKLFSPTFRAHWNVVSRSCRSDSGPSTKNARTYVPSLQKVNQ